jgi:uridine phosphorylase
VSIHIRPTAPLAERALLPADPGLALALAQALLDGPRMFNHNHGLWGYTGPALDGRPLTIQSTGLGGPSAAIVLEELIGIGLRQAIRVGTCTVLRATDRPLAGQLGLGDLLIVEAALATDGTSRALGAGELAVADDRLTRAMNAASARTRRGRVISSDLFYSREDDVRVAVRETGAVAVEMGAAALFTLGAREAVAIGCVLVVSDVLGDGRRERIEEASLESACARAGLVAAAGLGAGGAPPEAEVRA